MSHSWSRLLLPCLACCLLVPALSSTAVANEGQWKPEQIAEVHERAQRQGLELSPEALWNPEGDETNGGLMRASVNLSGCSAAFISEDGLIATNHHCAYSALQQNSSVEHDYLKDGFLAKTRAEELEAKGKSIKVLRKISDVSEPIAAKLEGIEDDGERASAYEQAKHELVDACEAASEHVECQVASFYLGSHHELHEYLELEDLRLVYAPPSAIGEYGGEIDNWMWPRHTGDFSLLRAYVGPDGQPAAHAADNVPYQPAIWLEPSTEGVDSGDFVAILGYPGRTQRYLWAAELERHHQGWLPMRVKIYGEWIEILEQAGARSEELGIKVAATKKSLANRHKNAAGKIAGLDHMNLIATRKAEDTRLALQEAAKPVIEGLAEISEARRERQAWAFLLHNLRYAPRKLAIARDLALWAQERSKPDVERKSGYRDRDRDRLWSRLERYAHDHDAEVDVELLASFLRHADALEGRRIPGFDQIMGEARGAGPEQLEAYREAARAPLEGSKLASLDTLRQLFEEPKKVARSKDPMIVLARELVEDLGELSEIEAAEKGKLLLLEPRYFELVKDLRSSPHYSDANRTLRFSYATVKGYEKWDGAKQEPQTVLAGAVAKHTGTKDFDLPDKVLEQAKIAADSRWVDREIDGVPVCFLADGDTTGGNSGSPVIDGRGRLVGFNFDRVWENVAGDYAWRPGHSRNVIADARYLYWMLEEAEGATHLLEELGVADYTPPPKPAPAAKEAAKVTSPAKKGCGCRTGPGAPGWAGSIFVVLGLGGLALGRRRRRVGSWAVPRGGPATGRRPA